MPDLLDLPLSVLGRTGVVHDVIGEPRLLFVGELRGATALDFGARASGTGRLVRRAKRSTFCSKLQVTTMTLSKSLSAPASISSAASTTAMPWGSPAQPPTSSYSGASQPQDVRWRSTGECGREKARFASLLRLMVPSSLRISRPKVRTTSPVGDCSRLVDLMGQRVRLKKMRTTFYQHDRNRRFAARDAASKSYAQHGYVYFIEKSAHPLRVLRRSLAAFTVLLISMAIVSGPTPPGTGVIAPATSATLG